MYDLILENGEIIDPAQKMHTVGSLAIENGKIAAQGKEIVKEAKKIVDLKGKIISPGLIDVHCHAVAGFSFLGVPADEVGVNNGVTLLCDGGTSGSANFATMREFIIGHSKTDMVCFLNVAKTGLIKLPEVITEYDIDFDETIRIADENRDVVKGIKVRATQALRDGLGVKAYC